MPRPGDVEGDSADTTVAYDQALIDPDYNADSDDEASRIWLYAQAIREIMDRRGDPLDKDRKHLRDAVLRQLQTLGLLREVKLAKAAARASGKSQTLDLYVLLFPGEGRDNTGIKDLNDNVLGYKVTSGFIEDRQDAISELFSDPESTPPPRYVTVGQDYKTASIIAYGKARTDFAADLVNLDARLKKALLDRLDEAEKDPVSDKHLAEIKKLRKKLGPKDKRYRFDFLFGTASIDPSKQSSEIEAAFLLLTHALKGAGIARFVSKAASRDSLKIGKGTGVKPDAAKLDSRGKAFDLNDYRKTTGAADKIKTLIAAGYNRDVSRDYMTIFVDKVWTSAYLLYRKLYWGNPDVIRDVRKRLLVKPTPKEGVKYTFRAQVELLELWLVALNELDFVKDFLLEEFRTQLVAYHELCYAALLQLRDPTLPIDWDRLEKLLTHDLRLTSDRVLVQGTTSEYQFYAYAADNDQQIFFTMDVRDLGVEVITWYELSNLILLEDKLADIKLMEETFESTKPITQRKRAAYDAVVAVMQKYFDQLSKPNAVNGRPAALKAFETGIRDPGLVSNFKLAVQVMLGGDEVFVVAHPYFAGFVTDIIGELDKATFKSDSHGKDLGDRRLDMRVSVAYSSAKKVGGALTSSGISPEQRVQNQRAHDKALRLGSSAASALKPLERTQRRIERLIDKLEANPKKAKLAPPFTQRLAQLGLLQLYVQVQYAHSASLTTARYEQLLAALDRGDLATAQGTKLVDLVDYSGNVVDVKKVASDAAKLEKDVSAAVWPDNYHMDGPPVTKMPPLAKKIIDLVIPDPMKDKDKKP